MLTYKKGRTPVFTSKCNTIGEANEPLVQFSKCFDAFVYNDIVYMINSNCESIFNMEYSHKIICKQHLAELESIKIIKDMEHYKKYAFYGQNPKKFITYDSLIVDKLRKIKFRSELSQKLKIPLDAKTNKFDLSNENNAKNFTLVICGKTKLNMFDHNVCEVPSSIPLNL